MGGPWLPLEERFWAKVRKTRGCWYWTASTRNGYGAFGVSFPVVVDAHRVSWTIHYGEIPKGLFVLHKCDNKLCVRPTHLFLGTAADNSSDMCRKGRQSRGMALPQTKLTAREKNQIVRLIKAGENQYVIAEKFGISQSRVSQIKLEVLV